jgi:hypothetical protein
MKAVSHFALLTAAALSLAAFPAAPQSTDLSAHDAGPDSTRPEVTQKGPSGIMSIVAGTGYWGNDGVPGPATDADLVMPQGVAVDSKGDFYISDPEQAVVYKVTAGRIAVYAGTGEGGYSGDGGLATKAKLNLPYGLALDAAGDLYIADQRNNRIRKVSASTGKISTVAGTGAGEGPGSIDDCPTPVDGIAATSSTLCLPLNITLDSSNNLYIADWGDNEIRKVTASTGKISTIAGSVSRAGYSGDGSLAINADLNYPRGVAVDAKGNVYIADGKNCAIREVTVATGIISTLVGSPGSPCQTAPSLSGTPAASAAIGIPQSVAVDASGNLFVADISYGLVYLIDAAKRNLYTIAGINFASSNPYESLGPEITLNSGPGTYQIMDQACGIAVDTSAASPTYGDVFFADGMDSVIYRITEAAAPPVNVPAITPAFPTGAASQLITIKATAAGSAIYYTTDGSLPTTASKKYTKPFTADQSAVITAFATKAGLPNSQASINVFIANPAPAFTPTSVSNPVGTTPVTITAGEGGVIYYTTDSSDPTAGGPTVKVYSKPIAVTDGETVKAAYLPSPVTDFAGNVWQQWSQITTNTFDIQLP